jgi:hypothetical protein
MKARGAYRATYESIDDDRDWRKLSPLAKATFDTLKRRLGQYGINIVAIEALPRIVNCTAAELDAAIGELEAPKHGGRYGWIRREEDVIWIVNGLRFEPTLFVGGPNANANHRLGAHRHAVQLHQLTRLAVVVEFAEYYGLDPMPSPMAYPIPLGMGGGMVGGITESESESESESETESETESESDARAKEPGSLAPGSAPPAGRLEYSELPDDVVRFGSKYYSRAAPKRRREIARQLLSLARGEGVRYKGNTIRAGSADRLALKCREVLEEDDVRKHDVAIAVLFTKLGDSTDTSKETLKQELETRAAEDKRNGEETTHAEAWLDSRGDVAAAIEEELHRQGYGAPKSDDAFAQMTRRWVRRGLLLTAWRQAGASELVHA